MKCQIEERKARNRPGSMMAMEGKVDSGNFEAGGRTREFVGVKPETKEER